MKNFHKTAIFFLTIGFCIPAFTAGVPENADRSPGTQRHKTPPPKGIRVPDEPIYNSKKAKKPGPTNTYAVIPSLVAANVRPTVFILDKKKLSLPQPVNLLEIWRALGTREIDVLLAPELATKVANAHGDREAQGKKLPEGRERKGFDYLEAVTAGMLEFKAKTGIPVHCEPAYLASNFYYSLPLEAPADPRTKLVLVEGDEKAVREAASKVAATLQVRLSPPSSDVTEVWRAYLDSYNCELVEYSLATNIMVVRATDDAMTNFLNLWTGM